MTPKQALIDYEICLKSIRKAEDDYARIKTVLVSKRMKIESYLLQQGVEFEALPLIVAEDRPFLNWNLKRKTDASAIETHMQIDDTMIPKLTASIKEEVDAQKAALEVIENWTLARLNECGVNNFSTDFGTASRMTVKRYSIADKKLFLKDALKHGYESDVTVSVRPNSKLMTTLVEENGELPAGVSMTQIYEARFTKGK
jgi:hypothetical protein